MGCTRRIAMSVVLTIGPGRLEFATGTRALLIHGAAHTATDFAHQPDAARRLGFCPEHRDVKRADLHSHAIRNSSAGRSAFTPEERHTKVRAASAACEAGIVDRHGKVNTERPERAGTWTAILFFATNLGRASQRAAQKISDKLIAGVLLSRHA